MKLFVPTKNVLITTNLSWLPTTLSAVPAPILLAKSFGLLYETRPLEWSFRITQSDMGRRFQTETLPRALAFRQRVDRR